MEEPSLKASRRVLAGLIAGGLALAVGGFLIGRATMPAPRPAPDPAQTASGATTPLPLPQWSGPLTRRELIGLAALAADTTASGMAPDEELVQSDGRRFEIRLPFGCDGPAAPDAQSGWTYDEGARTLRVFASPLRWSPAEWGAPADGAVAIEAVEGFWIEQPWTASEACPLPPPRPAQEQAQPARARPDVEGARETEAIPPPAPPAQPALAIGQVYTEASPRSSRRGGEPFQTVSRVAPADLDTSQGFRLRISGRLARSAGPAPAICRQPDPSRRPVCLLTATMDELAIENPATGETLATWTLDQRNAAAPE